MVLIKIYSRSLELGEGEVEPINFSSSGSEHIIESGGDLLNIIVDVLGDIGSIVGNEKILIERKR